MSEIKLHFYCENCHRVIENVEINPSIQGVIVTVPICECQKAKQEEK